MDHAITIGDADLAYAAGAIDSDGHITIKRCTYRMRIIKDQRNASYVPRIGLGQVTEAVPGFLKEIFGGSINISKPGTENSKPMFKWWVSDRAAANTAVLLRPFLKIKAEQAKSLIDLHELKTTPKVRTVAFWYARDHPDWKDDKLLTSQETAEILGLKAASLVSQSIRNGTLLSAVTPESRNSRTKHVPEGLVFELLASRKGGHRHISAPQYMAAQESLYSRVRVLNSPGVNGTPSSRREGCFTPAA